MKLEINKPSHLKKAIDCYYQEASRKRIIEKEVWTDTSTKRPVSTRVQLNDYLGTVQCLHDRRIQSPITSTDQLHLYCGQFDYLNIAETTHSRQNYKLARYTVRPDVGSLAAFGPDLYLDE